MKYLSLIACVLIVSCSGCIKDDKGCTNIKPEDEQSQILAYAQAKGIIATRHSSGMYYEIVAPGSGVTPGSSSKVTVTYTGKFLNDTQFDQSVTPISFYLNGVIEGWGVGIPLIKKGGKIKLMIPSSMAYGCNGARTIPANSVLYFDVDLIDVQ